MNSRLAGIAPSLIRAIAAKRRPTSIDLGIGEPVLRPSTDAFQAAVDWVAENGCPYTLNAGDAHLRDAIAKHYAYPGFDSAANVCITHGSQEALFIAISALLEPATDEILVVEPAFGSYVKIAEYCGITVRTVAMSADDAFAFDAERIFAALTPATRMLVICSPCNPTGRVLSSGQGALLAEKLAALGDAAPLVLFDEVYRELTFVDDAVSFANVYPKTIVVNSLSKSNALTGLRLGWAIANPEAIEWMTKSHSWVTSASSTYAQAVATYIFATPNRIREHAQSYAQRAADVTALLHASSLRFTPIDGTFYTMVQMPGGGNSITTALQLAEEDDVLVIPGRAFGEVSEGWLRMSFVAPLDSLAKGLRRIERRLSIYS